jgi:hypothetical protein
MTSTLDTVHPVIFISHDARDQKIAAAFAQLLRTATTGVLDPFWSSGSQPGQGIAFGANWFNQITTRIQAAKACVCLLTPRSWGRPWILFEAGLAKTNPDRDVFGVAIGVALDDLINTPFAQLQNSRDSEDDLTKLVLQLAKHSPLLRPEESLIRYHVRAFKQGIQELIDNGHIDDVPLQGEGLDTAALFEEVKRIPKDITAQVSELIQQHVVTSIDEISKVHAGLRASYQELCSEFKELITTREAVPISFEDHTAAQLAMFDCIRKALTSSPTRPVSIRAIGVSLRFSWPFLQESIPKLLQELPGSRFSIELAMIDSEFLYDQGIEDWASAAEDVKQGILDYVQSRTEADPVNVTLFLYYNLPQWHGVLVDNADLFLGRSEWRFNEVNPSSYQLTVGQNKYRWFRKNDRYGGFERIQLFNNWFEYFKLAGRKKKETGRRGRHKAPRHP